MTGLNRARVVDFFASAHECARPAGNAPKLRGHSEGSLTAGSTEATFANVGGLAHVAALTYAMAAGELFPIRFAHQRRREKFFTGS